MAEFESELRDRFGQQCAPEVITEAASICRVCDLSAEDLFYKWEAFILGFPGQHLNLTVDNLRELRKEVVKPGNNPTVKQEQPTSFGTPASSKPQLRKSLGRGNFDSMLDNLATPTAPKRSSIMKPAAAAVSATAPKQTPKPPIPSTSAHFEDTDMVTPAKPSSSSVFATKPEPVYRSSPTAAPLAPSFAAAAGSRDAKPLQVKSASLQALQTVRPKPSAFEARLDALKVIEALNTHLQPARSHAGALKSRVHLASNVNPSSFKYRYMFEKLMDRSDALDRRIDDAAELMRQHYSIEELGDPSLDSQEDCVCVGRICPDIQAAKLHDPADKSKTSIFLESSRLLGGGSRVELRFDSACTVRGLAGGDGGAGLFPGALVGVRGRNVGGHYFNVTELLMMPPIYPPESEPHKLLDYQYGHNNLDGKPMTIMLAAGPFTTEDNLDYAPLQALIDEAKQSRPDVLILLGPFIDANHPLVKVGDLTATPKQLFREHVSARLSGLFASSPSTTAILVPSLNDVLSHQIVYPQSPFEKDPELGLPRGAKVLPNPVIFSVNEIVFAITSTDSLFPLRTLEYVKEAAFSDAEEAAASEGIPKDNISRQCRHLLRQRSFYPIFPAPLPGSGLDGINLDVTHLDLLRFDEVSADIVITPSKLGGQFVKIVDSALVVNPSSLTKGSNGGIFARFTIHPTDQKELQAEAARATSQSAEFAAVTDHKVYERARVELIKV